MGIRRRSHFAGRMLRFCGRLGNFASGFGGNDRRPGSAGTSLPGERVVEAKNHHSGMKAQSCSSSDDGGEKRKIMKVKSWMGIEPPTIAVARMGDGPSGFVAGLNHFHNARADTLAGIEHGG